MGSTTTTVLDLVGCPVLATPPPVAGDRPAYAQATAQPEPGTAMPAS